MTDVALPLVTAPRRTYVGLVARDTLRSAGARLGLGWLAVTLVAAAFAPFLASSYPYMVRWADGSTTFPLFRFLHPVDVVLPVVLAGAIALALFTRVALSYRLAAFAALGVAVAVLAFALVDRPQRDEFDAHRRAVEAGQVSWSLSPPIPYSPRDRQRDLGDRRYQEPGVRGPHLMGTEGNGADVASRIIHASRVAISIGLISTGIALFIGVIVGGLMGYFSGIVDLLGMRIVEIFSAIPTLFLLLTLVAVMPPEWAPYRLYVIMTIIGLTSWVGYARFTRAEFLKLRKADYVQAALALGLPLRSVLFRHMLPNGVAPVLVSASFGIAGAIVSESVLSFLGLGLVDEPSWGQMLSEAVSGTGVFKWWMAVFPGGAIFLTVFAYNLIGEALRDAIDPHTKKAAAL